MLKDELLELELEIKLELLTELSSLTMTSVFNKLFIEPEYNLYSRLDF